MKLNLKSVIFGMIICAVLTGGIAFASTGAKNMWVEFENIAIVVKGETFIPRDVNGTVVEPFIVDGTTYLPVRAVSQALGYDVTWNDDTKTVTITDVWPELVEERQVKVMQFLCPYLKENALVIPYGNGMSNGGADRFRIKEVRYWGTGSSNAHCFYVTYDILPKNDDFYENGIYFHKGTMGESSTLPLDENNNLDFSYDRAVPEINNRSIFVLVEIQDGMPIYHLTNNKDTW